MWGEDLFRPFNSAVWICLLATILLLSAILKIVLNWEHINLLRRHRIKSDSTNKSMFSVLLITLGAYFQQGNTLISNWKFLIFVEPNITAALFIF